MKTSAMIVPLFAMIGSANAHVADLPAVEHAAGHVWLALALVPLLALLPLLRRRH